jgi:hypothetical protein
MNCNNNKIISMDLQQEKINRLFLSECSELYNDIRLTHHTTPPQDAEHVFEYRL